MVFANPHVLWLLALVPPALIAFFWWSARKRHALVQQFIPARLLPALTVGLAPGRERIALGSLVISSILLILALARPQWGYVWEETRSRGLDIVVAVDVSKSMLAEDIPPNRLTRARLAVLDLVQQARSDRLGLVAFAGTAFLQCPLTIDDAAFRQSLDALDVKTIPEGGTALAEAITTALTAFKTEDNHKVLVMFTDGEDHDSGAVEEASRAAQEGLRIFTVGIGTPEGELLRIRDAKGRADYIRDEAGNVVKSRLNEDLLRQVAGATEGGFYLPLRGARTVETLYEEGLAHLPRTDREERLMKRYHERYHWPLGLAVLLLVFEFLFPTRKPAPSPAGALGLKGRGALPAVLVCAWLTAPVPLAYASSSSALRQYRAGDYDRALQEYERLLQKKSEDPRLHFNAGAAAYRHRAFDQAANHFSEALNTPDLNLQQSAYYNRGNAWFELGEEAPEIAQKSEFWKKSVQDFESALKLNPKDPDAVYNRDVVRKLLEQLQQPPPQQQPDPNQKQDENQDQQADSQPQPSSEDSESQDKEQPSESQDGSEEQKQAAQQDADSQQQESGEQPQPQDQGQAEKPRPAGSARQDGQDEPSNAGQTQAETGPAGKMSPEQARQLLDAQKGQERMLPVPPDQKRTAPRRGPRRDW